MEELQVPNSHDSPKIITRNASTFHCGRYFRMCLDSRCSIMRLVHRFLLKVRPAPLADILKTLLRVTRINVDSPAGRFWVDPASQFGWHLSSTNGYEVEWTKEIQRLTRGVSTFVDVGANEGYYSIIAARNGARVLAIEPQQRLLRVIQTNVELNELTAVEIVNCAVSDRIGFAEIYISSSLNTGSSSFVRTTAYDLPKVRVRVATLESLLEDAGFATVEVMKMDIEGFE
ncbi:MAG TPA: FkbM family methyltransferase, partial [Xanthobacteraceae bacterium]